MGAGCSVTRCLVLSIEGVVCPAECVLSFGRTSLRCLALLQEPGRASDKLFAHSYQLESRPKAISWGRHTCRYRKDELGRGFWVSGRAAKLGWLRRMT